MSELVDLNKTLHAIEIALNKLNHSSLPIYADNASAIAGGLKAGDFYRVNSSIDPEPIYIVH